MFLLTPSERKIIIFIGVLILTGSLLKFFNVSLRKPIPAEAIFQAKIVNINTASQKELEQITGIGEKIAARIIEYRAHYGGFKTLEDLKRVKGIGDKKAEFIKKHITF